ncbi:VTT domain-containing protein [Phocaeicola coprocola]
MYKTGLKNFQTKLYRENPLFFYKYGKKTIIIARFIPVIRTFTPFVAGMGNMNYYTFLIYDFIGTIIWVSLFCITGYFFGNIPFVQQNFEMLVIGIVLISLCPAFIEYIRIKK